MQSHFSTEKNYVFDNVSLKLQSIASVCHTKSSNFFTENYGGFFGCMPVFPEFEYLDYNYFNSFLGQNVMQSHFLPEKLCVRKCILKTSVNR